jgi:DNA-binding transcriptional MerR regulator
MQVGFTPRQVTRLTGVPYSTLNLWAKSGLVNPSIAPGRGSGSERVYSFNDVVALKVAFELRKSGITTSSLKKVVEFLRQNDHMEMPLAEARLVVSGRDVLVVKNKRELVSALAKPGQSCLSFVVDLPRTWGELVQIADRGTAFAIGVFPNENVEPALPRKRPTSVTGQQRPKRLHK